MRDAIDLLKLVIPAEAGIQCLCKSGRRRWIPAFAGMTNSERATES